MARKIFKFGIDPKVLNERQDVTLPAGAELYDIGPQINQEGDPQLSVWVAVEPDNPPQVQPFMVVYTGDDVPEGDWQHWRTVVVGNGVYHVFIAPTMTSTTSN